MRHSMTRTLLVTCMALLAASSTAIAQPAPAASSPGTAGGLSVATLAVLSPATPCATMRTLRLPDVRITEVIDVRDSTQQRDLLRQRDQVRGPHCRVTGIAGKGILFVVVMPDQWNQRLYMGGNGGFAGSISRAAFANANLGYVAVSTNTGHENTADDNGARWALNDVERQLDYG